MADLARIKRNVAKMAAQNAPETDIDGYIASEGVTVDDVRAFKPAADPRDSILGKIDAGMRGAADILSLSFADEIAAGLGTGFGYLGDYEKELARQRGIDQSDADERGGYRLAGQIAGGVAGGAGLARQGLSMGANAAARGASLGRVAMGGAGDGAILGALSGAGAGTDAESRLTGAGIGGLVGTGLGAAAPYVIAGASKAIQPFTAPIMARLKPDQYAQKALIEGMRRSGKTNEEITAALRQAIDDGQDMFTIADAMGNSGQRMLSTVARNPHEGRQAVIEALQARQMDQSNRLSNALAEGFGAPDTAAARAAKLTAGRSAAANANYEAARQGAGAVDVSGALREIDDILQPGVNAIVRPQSGIADDSLESVVRRAQGLLTDGKSVNTNFTSVLRAKQDIQDLIGAAQRQGRNNQVKFLSQISGKLDESLSSASPGYRAANDTFRAQSREIDAVDLGTQAASGRTRAADNIRQFQSMPAGEQAAFRAGYADPMIARVESSSLSPTTNRARPLITKKTGQEFPAFAAPGKGEQMGRRIAREQRMFDTSNAALGGSKSADNLADAIDLNQFDPGVMSSLFRGDIKGIALGMVAKALNEGKGLPPRVITQLGKSLMETDPVAAQKLLTAGTNTVNNMARQKAVLGEVMTLLGASGAGRLAAP
jgi:hypothetical protein